MHLFSHFQFALLLSSMIFIQLGTMVVLLAWIQQDTISVIVFFSLRREIPLLLILRVLNKMIFLCYNHALSLENMPEI